VGGLFVRPLPGGHLAGAVEGLTPPAVTSALLPLSAKSGSLNETPAWATKQYCGDVRGERLIDTDSGDPAVDDVGVDAVGPSISGEHRALIDDAPGAAVLTGDDRCV
jgi:hypothetical protein